MKYQIEELLGDNLAFLEDDGIGNTVNTLTLITNNYYLKYIDKCPLYY